MKEFDANACHEYNELTRRQLFRGAGVAAAMAATLPAWLPQVAFAQDHASARDVLVSIYLRGGADGLSLCVPHGDKGYYAAGVRPTLAVPPPDSSDPNRVTDLNGFFGFAPAMTALVPAYKAGNLLVVHATGSVDGTRSHFDAQHNMEAGVPDDVTVHSGWLGRHLDSASPVKPDAALRALAIGNAVPFTLAGGDKTLPIPRPGSFGLVSSSKTQTENQEWLEKAYARMADPVKAAAENTINTVNLLRKLNFNGYVPGGGAVYPTSTFGQALKAAAVLIKADIGVEAIHIDLGGWDTHTQEGPVDGHLAALMKDFAGSLGAFHADIQAGSVPNVTTVAVSEFGRNVRENASRGTDHGHGNAMFVLGPKITGGRVLSKWPGLAPEQLYQKQDLQVTIDHRDILAEVVQKRLGNTQLDYIFPQFAPQFHGVTKP